MISDNIILSSHEYSGMVSIKECKIVSEYKSKYSTTLYIFNQAKLTS